MWLQNFAVWTGIFPPPKAPYPEDIMQDVRDSIAMDQAEERRMREAEVERVPIGTPRPTKTKRQLVRIEPLLLTYHCRRTSSK